MLLPRVIKALLLTYDFRFVIIKEKEKKVMMTKGVKKFYEKKDICRFGYSRSL